MQVLLNECKYIEKKVIRPINDNLSDFSSDDGSDEEQMFFDKYLSWQSFQLIINTYPSL